MIANYKDTQQIFLCESSLDNLTLCQANVKSVEKRSGWPMIWSSKQKATTAT